jgi:hypothetical protein
VGGAVEGLYKLWNPVVSSVYTLLNPVVSHSDEKRLVTQPLSLLIKRRREGALCVLYAKTCVEKCDLLVSSLCSFKWGSACTAATARCGELEQAKVAARTQAQAEEEEWRRRRAELEAERAAEHKARLS